jgi:hypothetical protein
MIGYFLERFAREAAPALRDIRLVYCASQATIEEQRCLGHCVKLHFRAGHCRHVGNQYICTCAN